MRTTKSLVTPAFFCAVALFAADQTTPPAFDVASVKPSAQPYLQIFPQRSGGRISWTTDLTYLIAYAYQLPLTRLSGQIPGSDRIYEIVATTNPSASEAQVRLMFQSLLKERFKMEAHRETKEADGFALVPGKGSLKVREAREGEPPPPMPPWMGKVAEASLDGRVVANLPTPGRVAITGRRVTMNQMAAALERQLNAFVADQTGLPGRYYFAFEFAAENHPPDLDLPTIFPALQDLGLKLEKRKIAVEVLVVDHIEKTAVEN